MADRERLITPPPNIGVINRVLNVSHPFARAIVYGRKIYELRRFPPYKSLDLKRFFIGETKNPVPFNGIHEDIKGYRPRPGHIIGSISTGGYFLLDSSHMNVQFASECGLTLDGLKQLKNEWKEVYSWILFDPQSYKHTKPTETFLLDKNKHGNVTSHTSVKPIR